MDGLIGKVRKVLEENTKANACYISPSDAREIFEDMAHVPQAFSSGFAHRLAGFHPGLLWIVDATIKSGEFRLE